MRHGSDALHCHALLTLNPLCSTILPEYDLIFIKEKRISTRENGACGRPDAEKPKTLFGVREGPVMPGRERRGFHDDSDYIVLIRGRLDGDENRYNATNRSMSNACEESG